MKDYWWGLSIDGLSKRIGTPLQDKIPSEFHSSLIAGFPFNQYLRRIFQRLKKNWIKKKINKNSMKKIQISLI